MPDLTAFQIATMPDIVGKGGMTTCDVFADALINHLTDNGFKAQKVVNKYTSQFGLPSSHAQVHFEDENGHTWVMDSLMQSPKLLP